MLLKKIALSGCFINSAKDVCLKKNENNEEIRIECYLEKKNGEFNKTSTIYNGKHLMNNDGDFYTKTMNVTNGRKIPKNIFRTFKYDWNENLKKSWTTKNLDYNYYFFNDDDCLKIIKENFNDEIYNTYMSLNIGAPRADLWRCCILYLYGGVYVDIDCECVNSIDEIIKDYDFVVGVDTDRAKYALFNAFMACSPRNNIMYHLINKIVYNTKNKMYIERHNRKGDAFSASGPGALGAAFSELLGKPYMTLYEECEMHNIDIPLYNRFIVGKKERNEYELKFPEDKQINNCIFYYPFSNNNDCEWKYNFTLNKNEHDKNKYIIQKTNDEHHDRNGWDHDLDIAINYKSSITITDTFFFGEYNYFIGESLTNNRIIEIHHNEYEKLVKNIQYLKIDISFKFDTSSFNTSGFSAPNHNDLFHYKIKSYNEKKIFIEIIRTDLNEGWGQPLEISIYYSSLIVNTNLNSNELINSEILIYDSFGYIKSKTTDIKKINYKLKYSFIINENQLLVSLDNYNCFIPVYTIINFVLPTPKYPEKQNIHLLWHQQTPEHISRKNKIYIKSQVLQEDKDKVIESYTRRCIYDLNYQHKQSLKLSDKKVCVICSFNYHYEMYSFLINYNKHYDFFANFEGDKYSYIHFYENLFNIKFKNINDFNHSNYDIIINHTDDNDMHNNHNKIPSEKLILIEHSYCERTNRKYYLTVVTRSEHQSPLLFPTFYAIQKEDKINILSKIENINIIYFNNCIDREFNINDKLIKLIIKTLSKYSINIYYRPNKHIEKIREIIYKNELNHKINWINISNTNTTNLFEYYINSHYSIIGDEHFNYSGSAGFCLSAGCQLLSSIIRKKTIICDSCLSYDELDMLTPNIDYDKIFLDIDNQIYKNNEILDNMIQLNQKNIFYVQTDL